MSDAISTDQRDVYFTEVIESLELQGSLYHLHRGLSRVSVEQLQAYSRDILDTELQSATSDYERFGRGSYEEWFSKGRTPYALLDDATHTLAALVWFGPKTLGRASLKHLTPEERIAEHEHTSGDWHTVSYRAYGQYRGKGLMRVFTEHAIADYLRLIPGVRLWLSIDTENEASRTFAKKLGFVEEEQLSNAAAHHYVYTYAHHG